MSERKSDIVYLGARDGQVQFDYFLTGLTGALFAYLAETYKPHRLVFDSTLFEPLALIFLATSLYLGLKRIETTISAMKLNHQALDAEEKAGSTTAAMQSGSSTYFNEESGKFISGEQMPLLRQELMIKAQAARNVWHEVADKGLRYYVWRNRFLLAGFASILLGRLLEPYI